MKSLQIPTKLIVIISPLFFAQGALSDNNSSATSATTALNSNLLWSENKTTFLLTGWYADFIFSAASEPVTCSGTYTPVSPTALDATGQTCYVNPVPAANVAPGGVVWFGPLPPYANHTPRDASGGIYAWHVVLGGSGSSTSTLSTSSGSRSSSSFSPYMPGPCEANGACTCGPFDSVRAGWNSPQDGIVPDFNNNPPAANWISTSGLFLPLFSTSQCNIQATFTSTVAGNTTNSSSIQRFAVLQASLLEVAVAPTGSPTRAPGQHGTTSGSSSVVVSPSLKVWAALTASLLLFVGK